MENTGKEDALLAAHTRDLCRASARSGESRFTDFLSEREQAVCGAEARRAGAEARFWGGWDGAERRMLGVGGGSPGPEEFPIAVLKAVIPKGFSLTHRDFLGALLALGLKREVVGDILIEGRKAWLFVCERTAALVLDEFQRAGRVGVTVERADPAEIQYTPEYEEYRATAASLRLDCVTAAALRCSRSEAAGKIENGLVSINGQVCDQPAERFPQEGKLSVRGKGRYLIETEGRQTRKGRLPLRIRRCK